MFSRDARGHMVHAGGVGWVLRELTGGGAQCICVVLDFIKAEAYRAFHRLQ